MSRIWEEAPELLEESALEIFGFILLIAVIGCGCYLAFNRRALEESAVGHSPIESAIYVVMQGPDKRHLVRLDPFARVGGPGTEGTWICVDVAGAMHVRVEGLDSQLGMVLLDLLELVGFRAMEGWIQVPSLACFEAPTADEFPEVVHLTLQFPDARIQMFMQRERLLEVVTRRIHPTASPRGARRLPARPESAEDVLAVIQTALQRYATNPALALSILEQSFGPGLPSHFDASLTAALAQVWGLSLRNAGRIEDAITRFGEGLERSEDPVARQELHYNRGYARLMGLMSARRADGDLVDSSFELRPENEADFALCLDDFREAARLGPEDRDAHSQVATSARCLAELRPRERDGLRIEARAALERATAGL